MNEHLTIAIECFKKAYAADEESYLRLAETATLIAQAGAAERQAVAMEKIAALLQGVTADMTNGEKVLNVYDCHAAAADWR